MSNGECPQRNLFLILSVSVTPVGDGGPAVPTGVSRKSPSASPSFPQGIPRRRKTGLGPRPRLPRPFGAATRPGIRGIRVTWPPPHPIPSPPRRKPVPPLVQFRSRGRARTQLPPPDPQRRALTELLCSPCPARLRFGSGLTLWPCGPVAWPGRRARPLPPSAGPAGSPSAPPRRLSRPRRPPQRLPGQRRASVT